MSDRNVRWKVLRHILRYCFFCLYICHRVTRTLISKYSAFTQNVAVRNFILVSLPLNKLNETAVTYNTISYLQFRLMFTVNCRLALTIQTKRMPELESVCLYSGVTAFMAQSLCTERA